MTLFDPPPPKPPIHIWRYIVLGILILLIAEGLYFFFRNYPEERAVTRFLTTLEQGKFQEAYRLWQPSPSYSFQDFLHDWGMQGDYGKIREFQILGTKSKGSSLVIVGIKVNNVDPPLHIVVERKTKGLSYSVFTQEELAVFGTITSVGVDRFDIRERDGSTQTVMVDEHTRYRQGQQDIQLEDLKPGDQVSVRGQANSKKEFVAEAVRRATADDMQRFQNAGERALGAIVSINKNQLKIGNPPQGETIVLVNEQTQIMKDGQPVALKDLKVGDRIFVLGKETKGQFLATRVVTGQFRGPGQGRGNQQ